MKTLISGNGLTLVGAGKMGEALLNGWISHGVDAKRISVIEPYPSEWLIALTNNGVHLNPETLKISEVCVIAVKPQMIKGVLEQKSFQYDSDTLFISIVAGVKLKKLSGLLDHGTAIVRVMPNTPATIQKGVSCLIPNKHTSEVQMKLAETLFSVVGKNIRIDDEKKMDAVTAVSGSGPAYVFYLIEVLTRVGLELGLDNELAGQLAVLTVSGAGVLAEESDLDVHQLRANVTSPNGTTEAALEVLSDAKTGLLPLMRKTVVAACEKSKILGP